MNSKKAFYAIIAMLVLLLAGTIGSVYLANNMLQVQSKKLLDLKLKHQVLEQEKVALTEAKQDIKKYRELNEIARVIVPQDKDQSRTVREIVKIAAASGIKPSSITFPVSELGTKAKALAPATPPAAGAPSAPVKADTSQLKPAKDVKGVYVLTINIAQSPGEPVTYNQFLDFLQRLENNRRTAQVSSIALQPSKDDPDLVSFKLTLDQYIRP